MVKPRRISDFKPTFTNLAQTSHYQLIFGGLPTGLRQHLNVRDIDYRFITETSGLLCNRAVLPGAAMATADIRGNYTGVVEKMAHTKVFTDISLEFYVDSEYKSLKFFEHWIDYISNGTEKFSPNVRKDDPAYFYRMRYPRGNSGYKCDKTKIVKFNVDYRSEIEYTFFGLFPTNLASTAVQYGSSDVLRCDVVFSYERYIAGRSTSLSFNRKKNENQVDPRG